ncbi:hypothetical protein GCM10010193_37640 [Kitasatospora atroaurantiaca]|uniref:PKD repeat protein n=1 Tax=Kitasatospora atroaurantiaca TaxID=285545 RepID=A0A561EUL7_9ACTN|nr:PKD domain-containing protein [Kitasatospora atroaurantiaca]TWE19298.1 PKD repeat protein [Kitasatospora atroaurantiaca]
MRTARIAGLAALVLSVTGGLPLAGAAQADTENLFVNNDPAAHCADSAAAAGSEAVPFCTVSAAANVVRPGQTVHIATGVYREDVHLTRSGTPGAPVTFVGPDRWAGGSAATITGAAHALSLEGVHDVTVRNLFAAGPQEAVLATDSGRVTLEGLTVNRAGSAGHYPGIRITGRSSEVTVSRNFVISSFGDGVAVDPGVEHAVITTNAFLGGGGHGVSVTDAPGTVVTSNTVVSTCGPGIELAGNSSESFVENNVLLAAEGSASPSGSCPSPTRVDLSVSAASAAGLKADYNLVGPGSHTPYAWAGETHPDVASYQKASGQGAHDISASPGFWRSPSERAATIDSADANAPGELSTALDGKPRVDDPLVANSGTGSGYYDRGAIEVQDPLRLWMSAAPTADDESPLEVTVTGTLSSPWAEITQSSVDFGDGTAPVGLPAFPVKHTYGAPGTYTVTATATNGLGATRTSTSVVTVAAPGPIQPQLTVVRDEKEGEWEHRPLRVLADTSATKSPWPIAGVSYDYGDGTPAGSSTDRHTYAAPGTYTVTATVTDIKGRSAKASRTVTVGSIFSTVAPARLLDTRNGTGSQPGAVGPGGVLKLQVTGRGNVPADGKVTAVLLNLTATTPTAAGFVTAYPSGSARPTVSNLNFTAGQTVANAVVVPVGPDGTISLYNHAGLTQLVADIEGYYTGAGVGSYLTAATPTRVLDTRDGTGAQQGKAGPGSTLRFKVRGLGGVPSDASAVVLNLTATEPTAGGYVTAAPDGNPPSHSSLNFSVGQTVANQVTVPIEPDGTVTLYNRSGNVHLIADIQGFYSVPASGTSPFLSTTPTRLLDTRGAKTLGPDSIVQVKVGGVAGVPAGATAVLVNLTATGPTTGGYLTAYAAGSTRPNTSIVNFTAGATVPNLALVPVSEDGYIEVYNRSGWTDVLVDLQGFTAAE